MDSGCMGFLHHPAQCTWEYIDPVQVALQAQADQILEAGVVGYLLRIEHPLY
ncbi:hypothetical protein ACIP5N_27560 [Streptomyces sp. NPDC088768]|uniref:hypothetical protein n=1 Tax=Streptomyces sp. NPDC088768 TaxID=3365894 RepID=UPI003810762D